MAAAPTLRLMERGNLRGLCPLPRWRPSRGPGARGFPEGRAGPSAPCDCAWPRAAAVAAVAKQAAGPAWQRARRRRPARAPPPPPPPSDGAAGLPRRGPAPAASGRAQAGPGSGPGRPAPARYRGQLQGQDLPGGAQDQPAAAALEGGEPPVAQALSRVTFMARCTPGGACTGVWRLPRHSFGAGIDG